MDEEIKRLEAAIAGLEAEIADLEVVDIFGWGFPFYSPLYRTVAEWLPGGPPYGEMGPLRRWVAGLLYGLYRLNLPRRGDVLLIVNLAEL